MDGKIITKNKKAIVLKACIDSRELVDGGIFVIIGDVHKYKDDIIRKASVIIGEYDLGKKTGFIKVENSIVALKKLASYLLEIYHPKIVAITGSNGKTTLKELVAKILQEKYKILKNNGNENNIIGICKTLLRLNETYDYCILEVGMNHIGEISELSLLIKPYYALITNIGTAHIGNLGSKKEIFKAKMEILDGMDVNNLIVNGDDNYLKHLKCFKVGESFFNNLKIRDIKVTLDNTVFVIKIKNKKYKIHFPYCGLHYPLLIGMAILLGLELDISIDDAIKSLKDFTIVDSRFQINKLKHNNYLIDDTYNASYESFLNIINLLKKDSHRKLFIIGDILEAGKYSDVLHLKIIKKIKKIKNCEVWIDGTYFNKYRHLLPNAYNYNKDKIIENIKYKKLNNTIIIVKASHKFAFNDICNVIKNKD